MFGLSFLLSDRITASISRHIGTAVGGGILVTGLADESTALAVGGAVTVIAGFGLSLIKEMVR